MIVEDGSRVPNADSYVDIAFSDSYLPVDDWGSSFTDPEKEELLIQATRAVDRLYGKQFQSSVVTYDQPLLWPRLAFYDIHGRLRLATAIPVELKQGVCEIAKLLSQGSDPYVENVGGIVKSESLTVDVISIDTEYQKAPTVATQPGWRVVDLCLQPIMKCSSVSRMVL